MSDNEHWHEGVRQYWAQSGGRVRTVQLRGYLLDFGAPRWAVLVLCDMADSGLLVEIIATTRSSGDLSREVGRWERAAVAGGFQEMYVREALRVWLTAIGAATPANIGHSAPASAVLAAKVQSATPTLAAPRLIPERVVYRVGGVEIPMMRLPAGLFQMGSPPSDSDAYDDERPKHWIRLTRGFELGVTPVTNAQWQAVMGTVPPSVWKEPNCPVERVSASDAEEFCIRLSAALGGAAFRLPTEAEWEYACRAGSDAPRYGALDEVAWYDDNSDGRTHEVGKKQANAWGLHDMLGNVWEWTSDTAYRSYNEASRSAQVVDPSEARGSVKVNRGGSWSSSGHNVRAGVRNVSFPGARNYVLGFRLARSTP